MEQCEQNETLQILFIMELVGQLTPSERKRVVCEIEAILSER